MIYKRGALFLFVLYVIVLFKLLFFKLTLNFSDISITDNHKASFHALFASSNFIPFYRIYYYASGQEPYLVGFLNLAGNVLLFLPMGFFLPLFFYRINSAKRLLITVAGMSLVIEILQLLTATGEFDTDDIILNTAGAMLGYFIFCKMKIFIPWYRNGSQPREGVVD